MQVSSYLSNYDSISGWNLVPGWLEDREILAVFPHPHDAFNVNLFAIESLQISPFRQLKLARSSRA
jgi:hypothetical protein